MKNVIVANFQPRKKAYSFTLLETYVKAQIENSLEVGWAAKDILLLANFDYEFMGVEAQQVSFDDSCLTGSKTFAVNELFKNCCLDEELWVHDLDAWQNVWFDCPRFKDMGICEHGEHSPLRFGGSSVFYRPAAKNIVAVVSFLLSNKKIREEPALHRVLSAPAYEHRVTVLDYTYNMGCAFFPERYLKSDKPIRVSHFRPDCPVGMKRHLLGQNELHVKTVNERLERLIRRYFDVSVALSNEA